MNFGTKGKELLKKFEGYNKSVYADPSGYPTVGYGHLLSKNKYTPNTNLSTANANKELRAAGLSYTSPITDNQANTLLDNDLKSASRAVNNLSCISKLTQTQFDALVSFVFNGGSGVLNTTDVKYLLSKPETFKGFVGPIDWVTMNQYVTNAFTYTKSNGVKLAGLVNRRNAEAALFCEGMRYSYNTIK